MAKDLYHDIVREAIEKEGWVITDDPYQIQAWDSAKYEIDLGAEKIIAAEKESEKIAVEIKSFLAPSVPHEFHKVLGQYLNYLTFLEITAPERKLYLAIPEQIYNDFFTKISTQFIINRFHVNIIVFDITQKSIILWLPN